MDKQAKLNRMWKNLPTMSKEAMMNELALLGVSQNYEDIVQALSQTYNDLEVADHIFATCTIDDTKSKYPKEFVDEAILKIAQEESFPFLHYGVITLHLQALEDPFITKQVKKDKSKEYFQQFLSLSKRFKLNNFDAFVYTIHDQFDMAEAILSYVSLLQEFPIEHREVVQFIDRFFQVFQQVNPWLDEQLQYAQATSLVALKSAKGEKMFLQMFQEFPDETEIVYRYMMAYKSLDKRKMLSIYQRYKKQIQKDSDFYDKVQKLSKS